MEEKKEPKVEGGFNINIGGLGFGDLLGGILGNLGNIEELLNMAEKLADAKGDSEAKEKVKRMREGLGKTEGKVNFETVKSQGLGGLLSQLLNFVEKAGKEGGEFTREFETPSGKKGVFSFGGRRGTLADREEKFEVRRQEPKAQKKPKSEEEMRQPNLDLFDEEDCIKIIGDMPGVSAEEIKCQIEDGFLTIWTEGIRKYRKEIKLPASVTEEVDLKYRNGVLEIKLPKKLE